MTQSKFRINLKTPHEHQRRFIESKARRLCIRAGRRSGKTTGVAILAVLRFLEGHRILYASKTMQQVDKEIRRILDEQYALATKILEEKRDKVEVMTNALMEWETIDADQIKDIMEGLAPRPPKPTQASTVPPSQNSTPSAPAPTAKPAEEA